MITKKDLLKSMVSKNKHRLALVFICTVILSTLSILPPKYIGTSVDFLKLNDFASTVQYILVAVGIMIVSGFIKYANDLFFFRMENKIVFSLRKKMLKSFLSFSYTDLENHKAGKMETCIMNDAESISGLLGRTSIGLITETIKFVFLLGMMFAISIPLTFFALLQAIPAVLLLFFFYKWYLRKNTAFKQSLDGAYAVINQYIGSMKTIKLLTLEKETYNSGKSVFEKVKDANFFVSRLDSRALLVYNIFPIFTILLVWIGGGYQVFKGTLSIGQLITFEMYTHMLISPLMSAMGLNKAISSAVIAMNRMLEVINSTNQNKNHHSSQPLPPLKSFSFQDVAFQYDDHKVLTGINFTLKKGSLTALVGPSGVGKTTLAHLMVGFLTPSTGRVLYNTTDICHLDGAEIRKKICFVENNTKLIGMNFREILLLPKTHERDDEAKEILSRLGLDAFIEYLYSDHRNWNIDFPKVSNGEMHRLALARALLRHPQLLIVDEALSSVDILLEYNIMKYFSEKKQDMAILLITHSQNFIDLFDSVFVVNNKDGNGLFKIANPSRQKIMETLVS